MRLSRLAIDERNEALKAGLDQQAAFSCVLDELRNIDKEIQGVLIGAEKWLGKMIADGAHMQSVSPEHCVETLRRVSELIQRGVKP